MRIPGVTVTYGDQCQYAAQVAHGPPKGCPIKKTTGFLSNSKSLANALSKTCTGTGGVCSRGGRHVHSSRWIAKEADIYVRGLCQAVIRGIVEQLREDRFLKSGCFGVQVPDDEEEIEAFCQDAAQGYSRNFKDDVIG